MPFYKVRCREDQKETNYDLAQEEPPREPSSYSMPPMGGN